MQGWRCRADGVGLASSVCGPFGGSAGRHGPSAIWRRWSGRPVATQNWTTWHRLAGCSSGCWAGFAFRLAKAAKGGLSAGCLVRRGAVSLSPHSRCCDLTARGPGRDKPARCGAATWQRRGALGPPPWRAVPGPAVGAAHLCPPPAADRIMGLWPTTCAGCLRPPLGVGMWPAHEHPAAGTVKPLG